MAGKIGTDYAVAFPARTGNGALAPGITIGDFTVRLRCLTTSVDAAGGDIPTIVDEGSGDYSAIIGNAFTTAQGAGEYYLRVSVDSASPRVRDVVSFDVEFHLRDFDDLAQPGDAMDLVADAVDAAAIATDAIDADAIAADAVTEIQAGLATAAALAAHDAALTAHDTIVVAGLVAINADTDDIQTRLPVSLVGGRMDSDVGNMQTDTVDANALATDAAQEIATVLETTGTNPHGTGAWDAVSAITPQAVRDAMKLAPTVGAPAAGSVDEHLDDILADAAELNDTKITTARADNLDEITAARLAELDPANMPADVDLLLSRLTAARAANLDEITAARLAELDPANMPADIDTLLSRLTALRAANLDEITAARLAELDPANLPADIDLLVARITAARAANLDEITPVRLAELDAGNIPADIDLLLSRLTAARALLLDNLAQLDGAAMPADVTAILARVDFELVRLHLYLGLLVGTPSVHTPTSITAGGIAQTVSVVGSTVTKTATS